LSFKTYLLLNGQHADSSIILVNDIQRSIYSSYPGNLTLTRKVLEAKGVDTKGLFRDIDLNIAEYEANAFKRVPVGKSVQFFDKAIELSGDPCFGLTVADYLNPAAYQQFGVGLLYSNTVRDFLNRFSRYFSFMTTLYEVEFKDEFNNAQLLLKPVTDIPPKCRQFDIDVFTAGIMKFLRTAYRPDYAPIEVYIGWCPPENQRGRYETLFGCPVIFGANLTGLKFDYFDLESPFPASNIQLAREQDKVVVDFLARAAKVELKHQVYSKLIEMLPSGKCTRDYIAETLNMSSGSLHSKLKKEGTNFHELLAETRKGLAQEYVRDVRISLTEIAYMLGYTNSSNFSRAFKNWTGSTPNAYRQNKLG